MRLIDADALKKIIEVAIKDSGFYQPIYQGFAKVIDVAPTIDAEPVRHGHWIYNKDTGEIRCNLCNALVGVTMYSDDVEPIAEVENFCFNCGAKMDGERRNDG